MNSSKKENQYDKFKSEILIACKTLDWNKLKKLLDCDQEQMYSSYNYTDESLIISMSCKLLASACFDAYNPDDKVKKQYGLNIWNKNLYWDIE